MNDSHLYYNISFIRNEQKCGMICLYAYLRDLSTAAGGKWPLHRGNCYEKIRVIIRLGKGHFIRYCSRLLLRVLYLSNGAGFLAEPFLWGHLFRADGSGTRGFDK